MGFQFGGTQANVTLSGGVTLTKNSATMITGSAAGVASVTLGTVPANKVWRVMSSALSGTGNGAGGVNYYLKFNDVSVITLYTGTAAGTVMSVSQNHSLSYADAVVLTAGQTVKVECTAAIGCASGSIVYVEEAA